MGSYCIASNANDKKSSTQQPLLLKSLVEYRSHFAEMAKSMSLVALSPPETLLFDFGRTGETRTILTITNTSNSKIIYKVKTTQPEWYAVRPNQDFLDVGQKVEVVVSVNDSEKCKVLDEGSSAVDIDKHRFMIVSKPITDSEYAALLSLSSTKRVDEFRKLWAAGNTSNSFKLKVMFLYPEDETSFKSATCLEYHSVSMLSSAPSDDVASPASFNSSHLPVTPVEALMKTSSTNSDAGSVVSPLVGGNAAIATVAGIDTVFTAMANSAQQLPASSAVVPELSTSAANLAMSEQHRPVENLTAIGDIGYKGVIALLDSYKPPHSCEAHMKKDLVKVLEGVEIDFIVGECILIAESRLQLLKSSIPRLSMDEAVAVVSYTYDLGFNSCNDGRDNLYVQFNNVLRERNPQKMQILKPYLSYLMRGLSHLPVFEGTVYRGIPLAALDMIQGNYMRGVSVHWSAFTSTTTDIATARKFAGDGGIIFHIHCITGRSVAAYSHFQNEAEIVISPNAKFFVSCPCELQQDGYYRLELIEQRKESNVVF